MIVQCPSCASRYRVNEANIPSTGGRIRCPSCEHAFVVYPDPTPSFEDDADDKTSVIMSPDLHEMMANHQSRSKSTPAPPIAHEEEAMTEVMDPSDIPSFVSDNGGKFGHADEPIVDDHTVEMQSPAALSRGLGQFRSTNIRQQDDGHTTELTADALKKGLQAAAAARNQAAQTGGAAPPPMPDARTSRMPADVVSKQVPAIPRPGQPTPHAAPHTLQKLGQRPPQPSFGTLSGAESKSKSGIRFPSEPAGSSRSFGEEPVVGQPVAPVQSAPFAAQPALGDDDATGVNMMAPVMVVSDPVPEHAGPDPNHVGPWHLRTNFGLTYEFPDTKGLRSWLSNRDELDGVMLSADGNEFFELNHFPQTQRIGQTGAMPAVNAPGAAQGFGGAASGQPPSPGAGFGGQQRLTSTPFSTADGQAAAPSAGFAPSPQFDAAPVQDPSSRITPEVYQPPSSGSKMGLLLWPVLIVLIVFAGALVLQTLDIVDLKSAIFGSGDEPSNAPLVAEVVAEPEASPDPQELLREQEAERAREARMRDQLDRIILTAEEDIDDNRLQIASEKLETAQKLDPKNVRVHEMLVDVYTRLGQARLAEQASETLARLRENPPPATDD